MNLLATCLLAIAPLSASPDAPAFTDQGELVFPSGYREWVFLGSGLGMTYGPAAPGPNENPSFDNVFVNPWAFSRFKETGRWPDGTVFVLEVRFSASKGSINRGGHFQSDLAALEVEVKDSRRFADGTAFYGFGGGLAPPRATAKALPADAGCLACHTRHGAVDGTFTQFYPTALAVAEARGTLRADYVPPPPSPARFAQVLGEQGWSAAERILVDARSQDPYSTVLQEGPLNRVAFTFLRQQDAARALPLFQWIADRFPRSANARDSLAEALEATGRREQALSETERALALVEADTSLEADARARLRKACADRRARLAGP